MPEAANIKSLDGLRDFRVALIDFIDKAKRATSSAESEINHMHSWLNNTQLMHWKHSIRRAEEKLSQAKSELFRATISQPDNPRGPTDQIKLVRKRKEEIATAQRKLQNTQRWVRIVEHEIHEYRSAMAPLTASLDGELQKAVVKIDNAINSIELYLADQVLESEVKQTVEEQISIARNGEDGKDQFNEHGDSQGTNIEGNEDTRSEME
jgi:hypothetical protein